MRKDIRYVPSSPAVVEAMLDLAHLKVDDVLYDLGSGDGRIALAAAGRGARAVGIDIDRSLVERSRELARSTAQASRVEYRVGDLFDTDYRDATVVTLYLTTILNRRLLPHLLEQLRPGSRIVSHSFAMPDWEPQRFIEVESKFLHQWTVPQGLGKNKIVEL